MKRTLQVAGGIVIGASVLLVARLLVIPLWADRTSQAVTASFEQMAERQSAAASRVRAEREAEKARARQEEQRRLEENCYVIAADGRKLTCPPGTRQWR